MTDEMSKDGNDVVIEMDEPVINNDVGIPDVSDADLASLRHKGREIGADGLKDEAPVKPAKRAEPVAAAEPEDGGEVEPEKEIKKPWARARVLEKERNQKDQQIASLEKKLEKMADALNQLSKAGIKPQESDVDAEEQIVDPETDPAGAIMQAVKNIKGDLEDLRRERDTNKQAEIVAGALTSVNEKLIQEVGEEPIFRAAVEHVARVMQRQMARRFPDMSEQERLSLVADKTNLTKLEWARDGKDPVWEMYAIAEDLGFNPDSVPAQAKAKAPAKAEDPKEVITKQKRKAAAAATTATVEGSALSKGYTGRELIEAGEADFSRKVDELVKAGVMRPGHSVARTPAFSELLPGKARRIG